MHTGCVVVTVLKRAYYWAMHESDPRHLAAKWQPDPVDVLSHRWFTQQRTYVIATVIDAGGSTPRLAGTRLIYSGIHFGGTIGGGAIELLVLERAEHLLQSERRVDIVDVHLVRDLGMCCGGKMTVFLNKVEAEPPLLIFGGGHIGRALATLANPQSFNVSLIDARQAWAAHEDAPDDVTFVHEDPEWFIKQMPQLDGSFVLIATHSHDLDQKITELLLSRDDTPSYLGLIGSQSKWLRFQKRLEVKGIGDARLNLVFCPSGLDINAQTPAEIAVSVLAQIIQIRRAST
jgi:xanthine dehydrogenase accessory factor